MPVTLHILPRRFARLARPLRHLLRHLRLTTGAWSISLVRAPQMSALHARTMGLHTTTDVLTFDLRDPPAKDRKSKVENRQSLDLDTVICLDEARRRARELGHPLTHELLLYALHSLLHVQGCDDATPAQARRMHAREDQLLTQIGIGPVFNPTRYPPSPDLHPNPSKRSLRLRASVGRNAPLQAGPSQDRKSRIPNRKSRRAP